MANFNWNCPYCNMAQTVTANQHTGGIISLRISGQFEGILGLYASAIGCSNPECLRTTIDAQIGSAGSSTGTFRLTGNNVIFGQRLVPQGNSKPQPEFVPEAIREDYYEACLIRDLSPKASATLTRRCLQGIIRDFTGIAKSRLIDEIKALRKAIDDGTADRSVTPETVDAIDHVRGVGNIGAHMEKDIDLIVPVDNGEAQALIELVEMLFDEWYGAREKRKSRLARIESIAVEKKALISELREQKGLPAPIANGLD